MRAGGCPRPRLRPAAPGLLAGPREPRGRLSIPGGARRPAPLVRAGTMEPKLVPRRRGGGEGSVRRPGSPDPVAPLSRPGGGASRFLQPGLHLLEGAPAPRRARLQYWFRAPCGAPLGPAKSPRSPLPSRCGARSRPGKARSPQCAKPSLGPVRTLPPSSGHSPGSSARSGCTRVRAPAGRRRLPRPPNQCPQERSERCAPARREARSLTPTPR